MKKFIKRNVCLVTEELAGIHGSGGIGAAFSELALLLASSGHDVDILYCPIANMAMSEITRSMEEWAARGIKFSVIDFDKYVWNKGYEAKSYSVYQALKNKKYDFIHFHDYKALGFAAVSAKHQGHSFIDTTLIVQMHGPSCWTLDINKSMYSHEDQLKIDFMEREMVEKADAVVSPSSYLISYLREKQGFKFPENTSVIKNACGSIVRDLSLNLEPKSSVECVDEIILFARHEERKGIVYFCDALDRLDEKLTEDGIKVTFLGKFGKVHNKHSGLFLAERAKKWNFNLKILPDLHRNEAVRYLTSNNSSLVVIPSEENSPYTVLESLCMKKPLLTSNAGGNRELIKKEYHTSALCDCNSAEGIYSGIAKLLNTPIRIPELDESTESIDIKWLEFHQQDIRIKTNFKIGKKPKVTVGITHYERPSKLIDAVISVIKQTYENIELIVLDDGSKKPETLAALDYVEKLLDKVSGRLIRSENGYLGAARNKIVKNSDSKYLCFLDDDDLMKSDLVEKLVLSAESSNAEVINCLNQFMDTSRRSEGVAFTDNFDEKVSYVPIGGPLSVGYSSNCLGSATALIRRDFFEKIGGYTELKAVGHEDYELFLNVLQHGGKIEVMPEALYLYEVGRPSMISSTPVIRNFKRIGDAIIVDKDSKSITDFMKLNIGKAAFHHEESTTNWRLNQDENGELIRRVSQGEITKRELLDSLVEYAKRINSLNFVDALENSDRNTRFSAKKLPGLGAKKGANWNGIAHFSSLLSDAKHESILGRHKKVCSLVISYLDEFKVFDLNASILVTQLRNCEGFTNDEALRLYDSINNSRIEVSDHEAMLSLFNLARIIGNDDLKQALITTYASHEEDDYLYRYGDVRENVEKGLFVSGLSHFLAFGMREGRNGYKYSLMCYQEV